MINRDMNRYENGKIYKIVDVGYAKCYIGSTCEKLSQRMTRHRAHYYRYLRGKKEKVRISSTLLFDMFGIENCKIELIENFPCETKEELLKREGFYIKENNNCINKNIAGRSYAEWTQDNQTKIQERKYHYRQDKKNILAQKRKQKREDNIEECREKELKHYYKHQDTILGRLKVKIQCECGVMMNKSSLSRHRKSTQHQQNLNKLNEHQRKVENT